MPTPIIRRLLLAFIGAATLFYLLSRYTPFVPTGFSFSPRFRWANAPFRHAHPALIEPPWTSGSAAAEIPRIQAALKPETDKAREKRLARQAAVLEAFQHTWKGYKRQAWLHDEISPISGGTKDPFGGWGATLIDSLDTLWLMDQKEWFDEAVLALHKVDFSECTLDDLNTFETVIRFIGGLLGAWDLCCEDDGHSEMSDLQHRRQKYAIILEKAIDVGEMMYRTFDTPNNIPIPRWSWRQGKAGRTQDQGDSMIMAELGSLTMEFTRLSQLTGNPKWFSAVQHISNALSEKQNHTRLPGLWPLAFNPTTLNFQDNNEFTMGGMVDSVYEYLPKMHLLIHGRLSVYETMFHTAAEAAKRYLLFEPQMPPAQHLSPLVLGWIDANGPLPEEETPENKRTFHLRAEGQHLTCFAGGMFALASRMFASSGFSPEDGNIGERLTDGCIWTYLYMKSGLGPEIWKAKPCLRGRAAATRAGEVDYEGRRGDCSWSAASQENALPAGMTQVIDGRYLLRPEAIESVFVLHRTTGDAKWAEMAWKMFEAIQAHCRTEHGYAAVENVVGNLKLVDSAESFWTGETLKYFFLVFSEPELMSLDEFVL